MDANNKSWGKYPIKIAGMIWGNKKYACTSCGKEVEGFKDRLSAREFEISGLCQDCQDKVFEEDKHGKR